MNLQLESYLWAKSRKKLEPKYWKIHNFMKSFNYLTKYTFITFSFKLVKLWTDENETGWPALTEFRWNTVDRYEFLGNFEALTGNVKYCIGHIIWRNASKLINRSYIVAYSWINMVRFESTESWFIWICSDSFRLTALVAYLVYAWYRKQRWCQLCFWILFWLAGQSK